jgi:formylglycine-generating enzyme required for sulfatase activity
MLSNSFPRLFAALIMTGALASSAPAQTLSSLGLTTEQGLRVHSYSVKPDRQNVLSVDLPLFTFLLNDTLCSSAVSAARPEGDSIVFAFGRKLAGSVRQEKLFSPGWKGALTLRNTSVETLTVANVVPLGEGADRAYITATGPATYLNRLSRSALFRPGFGPIGVVLPDNAWEMGFCDVHASSGGNLVAIARRTGSLKAEERRFRTILPPGASVSYAIYADDHPGDWHEGVRLMFHDRWLYDLGSFNDSLFRRSDLEWIRHSYLMTLLFAWDINYYDRFKGVYGFDKYIGEKRNLLGDYDVFMIWPTWPRLGVDPRNQFDMYRDMPGGLPELKRQSGLMHRRGGKYFISYNPWDESTRREEHLRGMEDLMRRTDADGVVLDTWGESSREFQAAADRVKPGIVLYSEGMAVPKDMPGIVAGRVHDALYMPPPLNMNKIIKPDFAIFRVMQVQEGRLHREAAVCLFNGYGAELNVMRTGRPDWMDEEYRYLGLVVKTLRENSEAFLSQEWTPLLPTTVDSVWVNKWPSRNKTVYTVYGLRPEGFTGPLVECPAAPDRHYVSLWHHTELDTLAVRGRTYLPARLEGFSREWLGTRREANVDCIAWLPRVLKADIQADSLFFSASKGSRIVVTAGNPSYGSRSAEFSSSARAISLYHTFGRYEGKVVIQLLDGTELIDERIVQLEPGTPRLVSPLARTPRTGDAPAGMSEIPAGRYTFVMAATDVPNPVIPYPDYSKPREVMMEEFFIDTYPVTNLQFRDFMRAAHYVPKDTVNFLRHWVNGAPPKDLYNHPVVWVSIEDARSFARWAGKRLPDDMEWQRAAQGTDGRKYPWGNIFDSTRCNYGMGHTSPVDAYPSGKSPYGVADMVGNVWQLTNDVYDNGSYYFVTMRGGSYYNPTSSMWYVQGGPWPVDKHQMLLMLSPGYDRNSTVGFRCVKDAH